MIRIPGMLRRTTASSNIRLRAVNRPHTTAKQITLDHNRATRIVRLTLLTTINPIMLEHKTPQAIHNTITLVQLIATLQRRDTERQHKASRRATVVVVAVGRTTRTVGIILSSNMLSPQLTPSRLSKRRPKLKFPTSNERHPHKRSL